jgi:hypothetical protein
LELFGLRKRKTNCWQFKNMSMSVPPFSDYLTSLGNTVSEGTLVASTDMNFIATSYRCFWDPIARYFHHLRGRVSLETVGSLLKVCRAMIYSAAVEACPALTIRTSSREPHKLA